MLSTHERSRWACLAILGVTLLGLSGVAGWDVRTRADAERVVRSDGLMNLGETASSLAGAANAVVSSDLQRLRAELRAEQAWTSVPEVASRLAGVDATTSRDDVDRRLQSILRRALEGSGVILALDVVVAGDRGLSAVRVAGDLVAPDVASPAVPGLAKALWYADDVHRAVAAAGRQVERGEISWEPLGEGGISRPARRAAIGLHDPEDVIQGAVIAWVDVSSLASEIEGLARPEQFVRVLSPSGRRILGGPDGDSSTADEHAWVARILEASALSEPFESEERLVWGSVLQRADGQSASLLLLADAPLPSVGLAGWGASPWPASFGALFVASLIASWALMKKGDGTVSVSQSEAVAGVEIPVDAVGAEADEDSSSPAVSHSFVLRDWLSDVRSCLERDAAKRGLALEMRCEQSLPVEVESHPGWLGGVLVALGREALDATGDDRLVVEVLGDPGSPLRFEIDAGDISIAPAPGLEALAAELGARFEGAREGRLALVLPQTLH